MPELIVMRAGSEVGRVELPNGEFRIGRDKGCGLVLLDPLVSRTHARVFKTPDGYVFEDTGSTHGSFIDGRRIGRELLRDGLRISVGVQDLVFSAREGVKAVSAASTITSLPSGLAPRQQPEPIVDFKTVLMSSDGAEEGERRLRALFEMSLAFDTAEDFAKLLETLIDRAISIMGAERGLLMLKEEPGGPLKVHVARSVDGSAAALDQETISRSLTERVLKERKGLLVGNALSDEWGTKSMIANRIHSALCVPLQNGGEVVGVIYVDHRTRVRAFSEQDLAFFTVFALQAKAAIDSSRAYWQLIDSLFRASDDLVAICSRDGIVTQANHGAAALLGMPQAAIAGKALTALVAESDQPMANALVADTVSGGLASGVELAFRGPNNARLPMSVSTFALRDRAGKPSGFCLIGRDQRQVRTLIEELTQANAKLQELNDMKSQFVGMISHELKSPLTAVVGYARVILDDKHEPASGKHQEFLKKMLKAGDRVIALIMELLEITRIETGKLELEMDNINLKQLVTECIDGLSLAARQKEVEVVADLEGLPYLNIDARLMRRVFDNLLSNAIKYNSPRGKATIWGRQEGETAVFRVSDTGIGMEAKDKERLFERFFRADAVSGIPGTGLGLSIVKAIVERHRGKIFVSSEPGKGTTFEFRLPIGGRL